MKKIEEFSDDEDYLPVSASRYFNKNKAHVEDHTNGTNGKASGVSISSADESKKSVADLDKFAFNRKRPIELLEDDDDDDDDVIVTKSAPVQMHEVLEVSFVTDVFLCNWFYIVFGGRYSS